MSDLFLFNNQIVTDGSMGADVTSSTQEIMGARSISVQCVWSAGSTPVGFTILQGSLDNINFTDLDSSSLGVSGNTGSNFYNVDLPAYPYIRVFYDRTSGSGTLNVKISAKGK